MKNGDEVMPTHGIANDYWESCAAVERRSGKVSGAWVFSGTRVPVHALFENLMAGASVDDFLEWFPGVEGWQVDSVLEHESKALGQLSPLVKVLSDRYVPVSLHRNLHYQTVQPPSTRIIWPVM